MYRWKWRFWSETPQIISFISFRPFEVKPFPHHPFSSPLFIPFPTPVFPLYLVKVLQTRKKSSYLKNLLDLYKFKWFVHIQFFLWKRPQFPSKPFHFQVTLYLYQDLYWSLYNKMGKTVTLFLHLFLKREKSRAIKYMRFFFNPFITNQIKKTLLKRGSILTKLKDVTKALSSSPTPFSFGYKSIPVFCSFVQWFWRKS